MVAETDSPGVDNSPPDDKQQRSMYGVLFGRLTQLLSIPVLGISFFLPTDGLGVKICWIKRLFDVPCPGCGLTRSITCLSQIEFEKAWHYHPFGYLIYAMFFSNVVLLLTGPRARRRVQDWFLRNDRVIRPIYWVLVTSFLLFGAIRLLVARYFI